ncbi:MAG TPA: hypothetical protein VNV66_03395 [Pilimelia sp.]|nr:hypothetical protein [Pilimelia sp.]
MSTGVVVSLICTALVLLGVVLMAVWEVRGKPGRAVDDHHETSGGGGGG